jgi:hypothetical protein
MNVSAARRPRFARIASLLGFAGFVLLTLCARWNAIEAQQGAQKKRNSEPLAPAKQSARKDRAPIEAAHSLTNGKQVDALALARIIDDSLRQRMTAEKVQVSPPADYAEFIRRVYLDLVGVIPPADKVKEFLDSKEPNKRAKIIDVLLADPRFGTHLAERWANLMIPRESNNRLLSAEPLKKWLAEGFNKGEPLNKLVYELITATGTQDNNGAVTYFIGNNTVDKITDNVTRMFLGVQLQCAQCHNHPFTDYKQNEYWAMAAFFMKTRASANPQQAAKKGVAIEVSESPKAPAAKKKGGLPESAKIVPAKFLRGEEPTIAPRDPARPVLAQWMTGDSNPYFARAMVNRFWYQLFGRGMVNPVDDMHADNAPVLPEILATLAEQLKLNQYDLKYVVRAICNTDAYQRTSRSASEDPVDPDLYNQRAVRVLSAEQLFDSLAEVLGPAPKAGFAEKAAGKKGGPQTLRGQFLNFFRVEDANPLDYQVGIPQALRLMNSAQTNRTEPAVARAMKTGKAPERVIEELYLMTVARRPTPPEQEKLKAFVTKQGETSRAYGDILWALLNSSEFVTNH